MSLLRFWLDVFSLELIFYIILLPIVATSHRISNISYLFVVIKSATEIVPFLSTSGDCPSHFYKIKYLLFAKKVFSSFLIVRLYCVSNFLHMQSIDKDIFGFLNYHISPSFLIHELITMVLINNILWMNGKTNNSKKDWKIIWQHRIQFLPSAEMKGNSNFDNKDIIHSTYTP